MSESVLAASLLTARCMHDRSVTIPSELEVVPTAAGRLHSDQYTKIIIINTPINLSFPLLRHTSMHGMWNELVLLQLYCCSAGALVLQRLQVLRERAHLLAAGLTRACRIGMAGQRRRPKNTPLCASAAKT